MRAHRGGARKRLGRRRPRGRFAPLPDPPRRDSQDHARPFAGGRARGQRRDRAKPRPCAIRAATKSSATWARRSTRPTTPISSRSQRIPFDADSALLLCSDGLSDQVTSAEIRARCGAPRGRPGSRGARVDRRRQPRRRQGQCHRGDRGRRALRRARRCPVHARAPALAGGRGRRRGRLSAWRRAPAAAWSRAPWTPPPVVIAAADPDGRDAAPGLRHHRRGPGRSASGRYGGSPRRRIPRAGALKSGVTLRSRVPREAVLRRARHRPAVPAQGVAASAHGFRILRRPASCRLPPASA